MNIFLHEVLCGVSDRVPLCAGLPQGSGVGPAAAAEPLEEAALPQGGEGGPSDSADAGEGLATSIHRIQKVTTQTESVFSSVSGGPRHFSFSIVLYYCKGEDFIQPYLHSSLKITDGL